MRPARAVSLERIVGMVGKEFHQVFRDPRMIRVIFVAPIVQLIIFGYAVSTDIQRTATFVVDHDRSRPSRELIDRLTASGYFRVVERSERPGDLVRALDRGDAVVGVHIPPGFAAGLRQGVGAEVQILIDGTQSNTATIVQGYAERILLDFGRSYGRAGSAGPPGSAVASADPGVTAAAAGGIDLRERAWYNPGLRSRDYNVPAVVGALILLVCQLLTALAVVREREIGTLEQLQVSPLRPFELIAGKTIPFGIIGLVDLAFVTAVALLWFRIPFVGSPLLLLAASLLYVLSGLGIGLLISTLSRTQQEAFMVSFMIFLPVILLSGFMFPVSSMPRLFQWLTVLNPMRHYIEIVRALFLKGTGSAAFWPQLVALFLIGTGLLGFATTRFRKAAA